MRRRAALTVIAALPALAWPFVPGCGRTGSDTVQPPRVVLYTSADDELARAIADAFAEHTGVRVDLVGDTEATKTTGLVTRLQAEKDSPRCDVWWSSEPMGTLLLQREGVLEPGAMRGAVPDGWPDELVGEGWSWIGFAERARVIVSSTERVQDPPATLAELAEPAWRGRVGMARPQFGTTRGHMALLRERWGPDAFDAWLGAMRDNGVRLYDGNARAVRAVYEGEIDVCLTDSDDALAAIERAWPVAMRTESERDDPRWPSPGVTTIPNTVGVIAGAPHPELARRLAWFLVSADAERLIAASNSHNRPVRADLRAIPGVPDWPASDRPDYRASGDDVGPAMDACDRLISP